MDRIGSLVNFLGQFVERRAKVALKALQFACSKWVDLSAAVIKLAQEFWCGQEPSPALIPNFVIISGHVVECASSKVSSKVREDAMITTIDDKDIVKEDDSTNDTTAVVVTIVCDSLKTDREDGAKQSQEDEEESAVREVFPLVSKRKRRAQKGHKGKQRSSKKKGAKSRAAYSLRGVDGEAAPPL